MTLAIYLTLTEYLKMTLVTHLTRTKKNLDIPNKSNDCDKVKKYALRRNIKPPQKLDL